MRHAAALPAWLLLGCAGAWAGEIVILEDHDAGARSAQAVQEAARRSAASAAEARESARESAGEDAMAAPVPIYRAEGESNATVRRVQARQHAGEEAPRPMRRCNAAGSSVGTIGEGSGAARSARTIERNNETIGNTCP